MSTKKTDPKPRSMTDYAFSIDWGALQHLQGAGQGFNPASPEAQTIQIIRGQIASEQLEALQDRMRDDKEDRAWRREERERRRAMGLSPRGSPMAAGAESEF